MNQALKTHMSILYCIVLLSVYAVFICAAGLAFRA